MRACCTWLRPCGIAIMFSNGSGPPAPADRRRARRSRCQLLGIRPRFRSEAAADVGRDTRTCDFSRPYAAAMSRGSGADPDSGVGARRPSSVQYAAPDRALYRRRRQPLVHDPCLDDHLAIADSAGVAVATGGRRWCRSPRVRITSSLRDTSGSITTGTGRSRFTSRRLPCGARVSETIATTG